MLPLGAPLRQIVRIERWGTWMILSYDLLGRGGERYAVREDGERPAFAAFRGNDTVLSGRFHLDPGGTCSYGWRVPLAASGQLRIVPSHDLRTLGPSEGEATLYTWRWFHCVPGLPLWSALVLAIVVPKANRTLRSLLILALVIFVYAGWWALAEVLPLDSLEHETSRIMILSLAVGLAMLWLIGRPLAGRTWTRSLLLAFAVAAGVVLLGAVSLGLTLSDRMIRFLSVAGVLMSAVAVGHVPACRGYRRHGRAWRFGLSLGVWTIAASVVGMLVMMATWCTTCGGWLGDADYILWLTFVVAPSFGAGVFTMSLLFALLGWGTCLSRIPPRAPAATS